MYNMETYVLELHTLFFSGVYKSQKIMITSLSIVDDLF